MARNRRKLKKQKLIIISIIFCMLFILTVGYAAFQTNITITAEGSIVKTPEECFTVSDNGDGTGTITDYNKECGTKVVIPETLNNLTITKIGEKSFQNKGLTYVRFPDTLIEIQPTAFWYNNLKQLIMPNSLKFIGGRAFQANQIENVVLNEGLETIGWGAFENNQLSSFKLPSTIKNLSSTIISCNNISEGNGEFVYQIDENGQIDYTKLVSFGGGYPTVNVPDGIEIIGPYSLMGGNKTETLNLPDSVTTISSYVALGNSKMTTINIGSNIQTINSSAFSYSETQVDASPIQTININRKENAVSGAPWGAVNAKVNWIGEN